jgi:DivIVA domain-containing protein
MSESPRWERESQEDLSAPAPQPDATVEFNAEAELGLELEPDADRDVADGDVADREPRLAAARESLFASRDTARESLSATADSARESLLTTADTLSTTAAKVGRWFASLDRRPDFDVSARRDPIAELTPGAPYDTTDDDDHDAPDTADDARSARFPLALRGYDRDAVDAHLARLETENALLREQVGPPMSITEEIERLGEQTASILVVAHDKAHETARNAHAQAARAVSDAARDAERITAEAERRLRELDDETDAVWRERERLLDDVREVSVTLASLADNASARFPPAEPEPEPQRQPDPTPMPVVFPDLTPEPVPANAE